MGRDHHFRMKLPFFPPPDTRDRVVSRLVFRLVVMPVLWWLVWRNAQWTESMTCLALFSAALGGAFGVVGGYFLWAGIVVVRMASSIGLLPVGTGWSLMFTSVLFALPGLLAGMTARDAFLLWSRRI